ncbi:MAG TPA: conjugal transfer protein TraG, partial [Sphingobium sp.]|nr:conjugal transfer protein TraG [Sphingobium sp.]
AREMGGLAPALDGRDLGDPATISAVRAAAATGAIHNFAEKDALRTLGNRYFGAGEAGEKAFGAFTQGLVQWRAFGDTRAYGMMMQQATRHFERAGYGNQDAELKASGVVAEASADPTFAKLIANSFAQEAMLRNDLTAAQVQVGAMEGRRDYAGDRVARVERGNVATEQAHRTGGNEGQRNAAAMLGLPVDEMSRRIAFINALSGEARSSAITQLSRATGRDEAQVTKALETYKAATDLGTADGATAEAAREGSSVYGRTKEAAGYDFAERSGKLDAQREVGHDGTRSAARIGEQRRQSENFGFAQGAEAAGMSTREAARLDSFIRTLADASGNQLDMAEGGADGIADRARNARMTSIVERERLSRMQGLLRANGIEMSKRQIAMGQNGDFSLNLTPATATQMWKAGLLNESQLGAVANGGHARFSLAHNDLLVSSSARFEKSARNDTSTRFEAGKQAGPDTIEHFMGGGVEGRAAMANWLKGGFEMDRMGDWRLKPQVADTLQRDVQAIMAQTGWDRSIGRTAQDQNTFSVSAQSEIGGSTSHVRGPSGRAKSNAAAGRVGGSIGFSSQETGSTNEVASAQLSVVNYDIRHAISNAERAASKTRNPAEAFASHLATDILGPHGLRNRYLREADSGRGTTDITAPVTSLEQSSILRTGRLSIDLGHGPTDGSPEFKTRD